MKQLLVGGGFVDFATLHPLWTGLVLTAAVVMMRRAARALGPNRQPRSKRRSAGGEHERPHPVSGLT